MPYTEEDAAYDMWWEQNLAEVRREYGSDIADEVTTDEIVNEIVRVHDEMVGAVSASLTKAEQRLVAAEPEEAVFYAARAFDGYLTSAYAKAVQKALEERFSLFMPDGIELKTKIFAAMHGAVAATPLAEYGIAVIAADRTESGRTITLLRTFLNGVWKHRNPVMHAPGAVTMAIATDFVGTTRTILHLLFDYVGAVQERRRLASEKIEFSDARVVPLHFLAKMHAEKPGEFADVIPQPTSPHERRDESLRALVNPGYIEKDDSDRYFSKYRITAAGLEYYEHTVKPRLPRHLQPRQADS